jgi:hypothetical protein
MANSDDDRAPGSLLRLSGSDLPLVLCVFHCLGVLSFIGIYWRRLHALSAATILLAMAIGCVANWLRHRTLHCGITGPLFLIAAVTFLLSDLRIVHVSSLLVWEFVLIGVGIAFLLEWLYARHSSS